MIEMTESYSTPREVKLQEYLLEKSLQELNVKEAQSEMSEAVEQLSMGPFVFDPQYNSLRVYVTGDCGSILVALRNRHGMISKKMFLIGVTEALRNRVQQDYPERREVDRGYANLILQLIKDSDVYDRIIKAYEHYNVALEALDKVTRILQAWDTEVEETEKGS